jgi:hypothetical protein
MGEGVGKARVWPPLLMDPQGGIPMSRRSPTVGRKVPRSAFVQDRRAILKLVPKLRKIKPAKGR